MLDTTHGVGERHRGKSNPLSDLRRVSTRSASDGMNRAPSEGFEPPNLLVRSQVFFPVELRRHGGGVGICTRVFRVILTKRYDRSQLQAGSCTAVSSLRLSQTLPWLHSVSPESPSPLLLPGCGDLALLSHCWVAKCCLAASFQTVARAASARMASASATMS